MTAEGDWPEVNRPRGVLLGSAGSLVYLGLQIVCAVALAPLALQALGRDHYDVWLALSQVLAWMVLADLGLGMGLTNAVVRARAAGDAERIARLVWTVTAALGLAGAGVALLGLAALWLPLEEWLPRAVEDGAALRQALAILLLAFGLRLPLTAIAYAWRGLQEPHRLTAWLALIPPVQLAGAWLAFRHFDGGAGLLALAAISGAVNLLALAGCTGHLLARHPALRRVRPRLDWSALRGLWPAAWPFLIIQLAAVVVLSTDNLVLIAADAPGTGPGEVAPYALPMRLSMMVHAALLAGLGVLWPALGDLHARGNDARVREVWARIVRITIWVAAAGAAGLIVLGRPVLGWWVPMVPFPADGLWLLAVLAAHLVLRSWVSLYAMAANALNMQRRYMPWLVAEAVLNLGLSLWWVQSGGRLGVALGTLAAVLVPAMVLPLQVGREMGVPVRMSLLRAARACWPGAAALGAAAAAGVVSPAPDATTNVVLAAVCGIGAGVAATLIGGTTGADRSFARRMLQRALGRTPPPQAG